MEPVVIAKVYLKEDPFVERPVNVLDSVHLRVSKSKLMTLLEQGWVQFFFTKITTGTETSVIATLNRNLYSYSFKGGTPAKARGLFRFVVYQRASAKQKPAWRSCYSMKVSEIIQEDKNQDGRPNRNVKVNVDSGSRTTIAWDYDNHKPL